MLDASNQELYNAHQFERIMMGGTCEFDIIENAQWFAVGHPACCRPPDFRDDP